MSEKKQALGKGLEVLFSSSGISQDEVKVIPEKLNLTEKSDFSLLIDIDKIKSNPYQPREEFDDSSLKDLSESIKQKGVIQAITVNKAQNGEYILIAGERRVRASKLVGLTKIPAYFIDANSKEDLLEISLIENIQRKDLNAIEVAKQYFRLVDECSLTQEQIADKVGKSRSVVANYLRMLKLPDEIQVSIKKNEINEGHARTILALNNELDQLNLWKRILGDNLSVRKAEELSKKLKRSKKEKIPFQSTDQSKSAISFLESKFREHFGTKVTLRPKSKTTGEIIIEYFTAEDLERIIDICKND
jgi:ParB family transcriptional regulator, chromosome partitioning protein